MSNCLFPVKFATLLLQGAPHMCSGGSPQDSIMAIPNDGLKRVVLMTPEARDAFVPDMEYKRIRLAYPSDTSLHRLCEYSKVEVYYPEGRLHKAYEIRNLTEVQALALQAELMYAVIESLGGHINPL